MVFGLAAVGQAHGVRGFPESPDSLWRFLAVSIRSLEAWVVVTGYGVGFVLHAVSIAFLPLYLAQTLVAMALPVTAVASALVERSLSGRRWGAVVVLTGGLVLVAVGAGDAGPSITSPVFGWAVLAALVAMALAVWLGRHGSGAQLGTLAGLGYAATAVSVRGITTPLSAQAVLSAVAVPIFGTMAFWVYSLGMRRAIVAAATAPMTLLQTLVPSVLGVALLGDTVRAGWWPVVVVGLVLASGAAVSLARHGERRDEPVAPGSVASGSTAS